jgi:NAD(P)-dependent dehydrogenase (short-subunit alcohol dehydrogenase family)
MHLNRDSVAFVTGAGSGIGRATAIAFARAGAKVCVTDLDAAAAERTAHDITALGTAIAFGLDVSDEAQVSQGIRRVVDHWGQLDYAVNNAGIRGALEEAHELGAAEFRRVMDINVLGVFLCLREELRVMYGAGQGAVVNLASTSGFVTTPRSIHYTASKHAVVGLTRSAAYEAAPRGIRINAVAPGTVETPLNIAIAGSETEMRARYTPACPIGRLGRPEEIAEAILWLCEERASFVTGHTLVLDGGMLLR